MTNEDLPDAELPDAELPDAELPRRPVPSPADAGVTDLALGQTVTGDELSVLVTGDEDVDALIAQLAAHAAVPLEEQLPILEAVHRTLQDRLADVEG
jgi:hypothetical protein